LKFVQWIYTAGEDSKYIYLIGGLSVAGSYIAKLDSVTLEVLQKIDLSPALYIGGLLIHKNGNVYCMHSNKLYAFWDGDLTNSTSFKLPSSLNGNAIQTNGMLVTQDGNLVVKQWNLILEDILLMVSAKSVFYKIYAAAFIGLLTIFMAVKYSQIKKNNPKKQGLEIVVSQMMNGIVFSGIGGAIIWLMIVIAAFQYILGSFDAVRYITGNTLFYGAGGGELKIIDPISLSVKASASLTERCSFARMSMVAVENEHGQDEDAIVMLGDEYTYQFRWRPSEQQLYKIPAWTQRYRYRGDGSFPGTGPAIFNNVVYFTDNTFPVFLRNNTYSAFGQSIMHYPVEKPMKASSTQNVEYDELYEQALVSTKLYQPVEEVNRLAAEIDQLPLSKRIQYRPPSTPFMKPFSLTSNGQAGFMFWSIVINPAVGDILVWDTAGKTVQSRHANNLTLHWQISNIAQGDCMSVAADKGHVYMTDYDISPTYVNDWMGAVASDIPKYRAARKHFIVANAETGDIIANKTISQVGEGIQASIIVPGKHNDIFIGTTNGLTRIYV